MYFYFDDLFQQALRGINATAVPTTMVQIAGAILLAALLFNVYEAFARGGDVRTLATGAAKYLILGLILLNYERIFLGVNTMFTQLAEFISRTGPGGADVFRRWGKDMVAFATGDPSFPQIFFALTIGTPSAVLSMILVLIGLVFYSVAYALFCLFYAFYGCVLYVVGPLVLALYPALSTTPLARTYLTNLIIFHAWSLIYAILGCLMAAVNLGTLGQMLASGSVSGFFVGAGNTLLLSLAGILFALCIALIPFIARRIVQGDVGSTMFAVVGAAMTAATVGATLAVNGLTALAQRGGDGGGSGSGGGSAPGGGGGRHTSTVAEQSSQTAPRPPEGEEPAAPKDEGSSTGSDAAHGSGGPNGTSTVVTEQRGVAQKGEGGGGGSASPRDSKSASHGSRSSQRPRVYSPLDVAAMAAWGAGSLVNKGARKMNDALRSRDSGSATDKERKG